MGAAEGTSGAALPMSLSGTELLPEARALWQGVPVSFASGTVVAARAAGRGTEASPLEPGGMLSVSLVQGDMEMAGSGTITYISGKKVLLFGHPLFALGPVDLPLWAANVPGYVCSF